MPVILFRGNNIFGFCIVILFLVFECGLYSYKCKIQYEIKKNKKEYELLMEKLEQEKMDFVNEM